MLSRKLQKTNHNPVYFDQNSVQKLSCQKRLGIYVDTKLNFQEHLKTLLSKLNRTIRLVYKLLAFLPCQSLATVDKEFIRPHFYNWHIIYHQTFNESFHQKMESIQYNSALAITGAIRGAS